MIVEEPSSVERKCRFTKWPENLVKCFLYLQSKLKLNLKVVFSRCRVHDTENTSFLSSFMQFPLQGIVPDPLLVLTSALIFLGSTMLSSCLKKLQKICCEIYFCKNVQSVVCDSSPSLVLNSHNAYFLTYTHTKQSWYTQVLIDESFLWT